MDISQSINWGEHEKSTRFVFYLAAFTFLTLGEWKAPRRPARISKTLRWTNNLGVTLLNYLILRFLLPGSVLFTAHEAFNLHFGLFNWVEVPLIFSIVWTIIILDITVYYLHRAFHADHRLWKIHRVHHADLEVDISTSFRFHPLELIMLWLIKSVVIFLFGLPIMGVFLFEAVLTLSSMFNHSNLRLPLLLDKFLRWFLVTPDLHRVHHSAKMTEANRNFGFIFSLWDKLFGTYLAEPQKGQMYMRIGLDAFNDPKYLKGGQILLIPFMDNKGQAAWNNLTKVE